MEEDNRSLQQYPFNLLTEYFLKGNHISAEQEYEVFSIPAKELLLPSRLDLMAKWIYIDAYEKRLDRKIAREIYVRHIEAFSLGTYMEPGSKDKDSVLKYLEVFENLIEEFKEKEFDDTISLIPIGKNNELLDGAHRCACAAYYGKEVTVIKFPELERNYNYIFFQKRLLDETILDRMALEYCYTHNQVYFACFWPVAENDVLQEQALKMISECGNVVYEKKLGINYNAIFNFMSQIYGHQEWTGTYKNNHQGVRSKADKCFKNKNKMRIAIFECSVFEKVIEVKGKIRTLFNLENHAIHISDNVNETRLMADLLLNPNSIHHLNYGYPDRAETFNQLFQIYREKLEDTQGKENYIIDSSSVLAVYGIRDSRDLDFLTLDRDWPKIFGDSEGIDNHEDQLKYYGLCKEDMLYNTNNYFIYNGIKFLSLEVLKQMKEQRNEKKDRKDIKLMNSLLKKKWHGEIFNRSFRSRKYLNFRRKYKLYGEKDSASKRLRATIKAKILHWKCLRKNGLEYMLRKRLSGKIVLGFLYPFAKVMGKEIQWKIYYDYWFLHNCSREG